MVGLFAIVYVFMSILWIVCASVYLILFDRFQFGCQRRLSILVSEISTVSKNYLIRGDEH